MSGRTERCCGTCRWHMHDDGGTQDEWVCDNIESSCYADLTEYSDTCLDWEVRQ